MGIQYSFYIINTEVCTFNGTTDTTNITSGYRQCAAITKSGKDAKE